MHYVAAVIFSKDLSSVLLIKKNRPSWQAGHWNLIGGKVEPGETAGEAVVREVFEEAGLVIRDPPQIASLGRIMDVFMAIADLSLARSLTDEAIAVFKSDLSNADLLVRDVRELVRSALTVARK